MMEESSWNVNLVQMLLWSKFCQMTAADYQLCTCRLNASLEHIDYIYDVMHVFQLI